MENDVKKHRGDNMGGGNSLRILPVAGLDQNPSVVNNEVYLEQIPKSGYRWFDVYFTEYTMQYREESSHSDQGTSLKKTLTCKVPKNRPEVTDAFASMKDQKYVLDFLDNNGKRRLCGSIDEPMYFRWTSDTKTNTSDRNEYDVTFEGEGVNPSPFYP